MAERQNSPGWATYLRVSDEDKQTPERSFAMQRKSILDNLIASSDHSFKREYRDMLTGTNPNRKDYQQMLNDAEVGNFSHLGLYRADRFGRNTVEGLQAATRLIGLGIRIRVANMPSLTPEEPDGFFMFLIQMGMAQREVDILRQRTRDGAEAKLRAGGWPNKAPSGYLNKERLIKSGKYDRWVEPDPNYIHVLRDAWDLLLTDRYTLIDICEELARKGYARFSGRPWVWNDSKTGKQCNARSHLQHIFHNPFYAGWAVSKEYGIPYGEIRGIWEPIISTKEYERGVEILRKHDAQKSRAKRHFYLLRNMLWVRANGNTFKLYGTTPSGRSRKYSYYMSQAKLNGKKIHIPCNIIDEQMPEWLQSITVNSDLVPTIQKMYRTQVQQVTDGDREEKSGEINQRLAKLRDEEAHLGRLLITGKISEESFDRLRVEWQEKIRYVHSKLDDLERKSSVHLDDLDSAIALMPVMFQLFDRLKKKERSILLQVLVKRIIVDLHGEIIDYELNSPFAYFRSIVDHFHIQDLNLGGSEQVQAPLLKKPPTFCSAVF